MQAFSQLYHGKYNFSGTQELSNWNANIKENSTLIFQFLWEGKNLISVGTSLWIAKIQSVVSIWDFPPLLDKAK